MSATHSPRLDALAYVSSVEPLSQTEEERVQAYAKLEFPQHDFFIRKLSIIIGRRPPSSKQQQTIKQEEIDVDLGPIRAVSRKHAALFYDWPFGRWSIHVLGRNGCVVDGRWKARSEIIPLRTRTKIQIAERIFYFILPTQDQPHPTPQSPQPTTITQQPSPAAEPLQEPPLLPTNTNSNDEDENWIGCESDCGSTVPPCQPPEAPPNSEDESNSESEDDNDDDDDEDEEDDDDPLLKSDDEPRPPSPPRHEATNYHPSERVDFNLIHSESDSDSMDEDELELPYYSYSLAGKAPASKAPRKTASKAPRGRGKTAGKASASSLIIHQSSPEKTPTTDIIVEPLKQQPAGKGKGKSAGKTKQPIPKPENPLPIKERPKISAVTPPGAEIGTVTQKPPYTYASLITQALAAQADQDGKMLVSEMCEWMAGVYPFYGAKEKGSDWQSAVRHNLNADKRFKRIERMPTDGGKGNFWTLREEEWVNFDGLELRRQKEIKPIKPVEPKPTSCTPIVPKTTTTTTTTTIIGRQLDGAPSRSIGTVARSDIGAHHRTAASQTAQAGSPPHPDTAHAHRARQLPPPPPPPTDLPVFSGHDDEPLDFQPPMPPLSDPPLPQDPIDTTPAAPAPIDPNLLACSTSTPSSSLVSHPPPLLPPLVPPLLPPTVTPTRPTTTTTRPTTTATTAAKAAAATTTTTTTSKASTPAPKFQIVIQEPSSSSLSSTAASNAPKTQEELKKLIENEPPMVVSGHTLLLNPLFFKELKTSQIVSLQKLGPQSAIKILQKFIVGYFKEKIKKASAVPAPAPASTLAKERQEARRGPPEIIDVDADDDDDDKGPSSAPPPPSSSAPPSTPAIPPLNPLKRKPDTLEPSPDAPINPIFLPPPSASSSSSALALSPALALHSKKLKLNPG
ncbi:hypothetical protein PTTG_25169 [Puccinia triticina 1-1 BBBD Race 1]|uniref:FHA domain-containing protein n=1 Tax=Puccinia triticina (isolate 1-1 / race 1 (BBBD)) TaxID=630390 RepID=A0A180H533_PUCT1|nr:hypothetical protein PTTG_25169 [Puccinia triticina 1-1 BBBD Race 1]